MLKQPLRPFYLYLHTYEYWDLTNNTSQITPTMLTLRSINLPVPEGNGSILILQTILGGTITHSSGCR